MVEWQYYPKSDQIPVHLLDVVKVFKKHESSIDSKKNKLDSNRVLSAVREDLSGLGFRVEKSKASSDKIKVPVLFGRNGALEKYFDADAYNTDTKTVIEVEAGRAYTNNQFLKDLFQACVMQDAKYLVIAVRKIYLGNQDFEKISLFMDSLYASGRLKLPLDGVLVIGY
jgi:hypothetical protein